MDRMQSELKALLAQAQATQASLAQLQTQEASAPPTWELPSLPSLPAVDGLAAALFAALALVLALTFAWRWRRAKLSSAGPGGMVEPPKPAPESQWNDALAEDSRFWEPEDVAQAEAQSAPEPAPAPALKPAPIPKPVQKPTPVLAPKPTPKPVSVSEPMSLAASAPLPEPQAIGNEDESITAPSPSAVAFDLEAATSEVARVRKTLAERREARALQRAQDAQRLLEAALQPEAPIKSVDFSWDFEGASDPQHAVAVSPLSHPIPAYPVLPTETPMDLELDLEAEAEAVLPLADSSLPAPAMEDIYAIKLALAQESEAIELWPEARELANEVLESRHADLQEQAQALLARIDQREGEGT